MLASINPLGERARGSRFGVTATAYAAGSVVGGAVVGSAAGVVGAALGAALGALGWHADAAARATLGLAAIGLLCVLGVVSDLRSHVPTVHRQVNEDWLVRYRGWVYGVGFGFQLGLGVVTVVNTAAIYLAFALASLGGSLTGGLAVGVVFGAVRAVPILSVARVRGADDLRRLHRRLAARAVTGRSVAVAGMAVAGLVGIVGTALR